MKEEEWQQICYEVAREHPEWVQITFQAFSAGVKAQAKMNAEKVSNMATALAGLYVHKSGKRNQEMRKLARQRLIESRVFETSEFGKQLESEE